MILGYEVKPPLKKKQFFMIMIYYVIWPRVKDSASLEVTSGWICQSKSPTPYFHAVTPGNVFTKGLNSLLSKRAQNRPISVSFLIRTSVQ